MGAPGPAGGRGSYSLGSDGLPRERGSPFSMTQKERGTLGQRGTGNTLNVQHEATGFAIGDTQ